MFTGKNKDLQEIINLRDNGQLKEAIEKTVEFNKGKHSQEYTIRGKLIDALLNANIGFWEKSLASIEEIVPASIKSENKLLLIDTYIVKANCILYAQQYMNCLEQIKITEKMLMKTLKSASYDYRIRKVHLLHLESRCLSWMGDPKEALKIAQEGFTIAKSLDDSLLLMRFYGLLGLCNFQTDSYEEAIANYKIGYKLAMKSKNDHFIMDFALRLAENYRGTGNFKLSMKYADMAIDYCNKIGSNSDWIKYFKGILHWNMGEIEESIIIFKEVIPLVEEETTHKERGLVLMGKAVIEMAEGDINKSVEYLTEAVKLAKEKNDFFSENIFSSVLILALFDKGEFDRVLEICFYMLDTFKDGRKPVSLYSIYFEMGKTYHVKGEYNLAFEYTHQALELFKKYDRDIFIAMSLFTLIQISIDKNDSELYMNYLEELEKFVKSHPTIYFEQTYQTAQALVLKTSTRPRDWIKAIDILIKVVEEKSTKHGYPLVALITLCELLMNEYSISGNEQVLEELEFYIKELSELAQKQNIYHLRLEVNNLQILTLWLKAQNSKIEIDLQKAKNLLENTRKVADEAGMIRLAENMTYQQEKLLKQLSQWDDFIRQYYEFIK